MLQRGNFPQRTAAATAPR